MRIPSLSQALHPLAAIAIAHEIHTFRPYARADAAYSDIEIYSGRGGRRLLTLADAYAARDAIASGRGLEEAAEPLVQIARAWDANELDDEARKFYGPKLEYRTTTHPADIDLVANDGGYALLTLEDALEARAARAQHRASAEHQGAA